MEEQIKALENKYNVKINLRNAFGKTMYSVHYNKSNLSGVFKSVDQIEETCLKVLKAENIELTSIISKIENEYIECYSEHNDYAISLNDKDVLKIDCLVNVKSNLLNILDQHINDIEPFKSICINTKRTENTKFSRDYIIKLNGKFFIGKSGVYKKISQDHAAGWYNTFDNEGENFNFNNNKQDSKIIEGMRTLRGIVKDLFLYCKENEININTLEILSI
ncbi:hypothetical protein [Terrisporobacter sp.]|uniref:hypothetical protein n=1 Tax=Terrisporobacter sp. TaxID=1965305 RepID=UPI00289A2662|nr:hypothetical protein [Terrisporobacter sp.]